MADEIYVDQKTSVPHTWHAAEMFLYLLDNGPGDGDTIALHEGVD